METRTKAIRTIFFPLSKYRGCFRVKRCEYCAIPVEGLRGSTPEAFWEEIQQLYDEAGIDKFFETADIFPIKEAAVLAAARPQSLEHVQTRMYLYPGMVTEQYAADLAGMGCVQVFIGVESSRYFADSKFDSPSPNRTHKRGYSMDAFVDDVQLLAKHGIGVFPSFVLGLPGETKESLEETLEFAQRLAEEDNVWEMNLPLVTPLPGSPYFDQFVSEVVMVYKYGLATARMLHTTDKIDYPLLSKLFIEKFTDVSYNQIKGLREKYKERMPQMLFQNWAE